MCAPHLCGSVTDRMRPLDRRCRGDNQYGSPRCAAPALSLVMGHRGVWLTNSQGNMDTHSQTPPSAVVFICDKINDLTASLEISPTDVLSFYMFLCSFLTFRVNSEIRHHRCFGKVKKRKLFLHHTIPPCTLWGSYYLQIN